MPRFSFPMPGRRKHDVPTVAAPQLTKAQKILGNSQISVDASTLAALPLPPLQPRPGEPSPPRIAHPPVSHKVRSWDAQSTANTCISISISEGSHGHGGVYEDNAVGVVSHPGLPDSNTAYQGVGSHSPAASRRPAPHGDFDGESGVLPRKFLAPSGRGAGSPRDIYGSENVDDASIARYSMDMHSITDASSVRRKHSASTIVSYYDKTKVPLVISQQTSNSAMAKGLPTKASTLLDLDDSISNANRKAKKRPSRLDLSRMFSSSSSDKGTDTSRTPSLKSASLKHMPRPKSNHNKTSDPNGPAKLRKTTSTADMASSDSVQAAATLHRPRRNSMRSGKSGKTGSASKAMSQPPPTSSQDAAGLQNLYEHYAQMTFRDVFTEAQAEADAEAGAAAAAAALAEASVVLTEDDLMAEDGENYDMDLASLDVGHSARADMHDARYARSQEAASQHHAPRPAPSYKDNIAAYLGGYESTLALQRAEALSKPSLQLAMQQQSEHSGDSHSSLLHPADCSESISSRHTRTSRASKRTSMSMEPDLQQTSILSLSSDSEEDDECGSWPKSSSSVGDSSRPAMPRSLSSRQGRAHPSTSGRIDCEAQPLSTTIHVQQPSQLPPLLSDMDRFVAVPAAASSSRTSLAAPGDNGLSSQNSHNSLNSTTSTARPPTMRDTWALASSRESTISAASHRTSTSGRTALSQHLMAESAQGRYTVHEARAITLIPAQGASYDGSTQSSMQNGLSPLSSGSATSSSPDVRTALWAFSSSAQQSLVDRQTHSASADQPVSSSQPLTSISTNSTKHAKHTKHASKSDAEDVRSRARVSKAITSSSRGSSPGLDFRAAAPTPPPSFAPPAIPQNHAVPQPSQPAQSGQGRYISVTRQEEALLAAFRKKRIQMRESIMAEFESGQGVEDADADADAEDANDAQARGRHDALAARLPLRPQSEASVRRSSSTQAPIKRRASQKSAHRPALSQASSSAASFKDSHMQFEDSAFPVPPSTTIRRSVSMRSNSVSSGTRRTSLSLFPPTASTSASASAPRPVSPGLPPSSGLQSSMMWKDPPSPRSKPPAVALPPVPSQSSRSRFSSEPLSPRSVPASSMTLPSLATINEPHSRRAMMDDPLSPRSMPPPSTRLVVTPPKYTAKRAARDRGPTELEMTQREHRESTSASGSLTDSSTPSGGGGSDDTSPGRIISDDDDDADNGSRLGTSSWVFPAVPSRRSSASPASGLTAPNPRSRKRPQPPPLVASNAGRRLNLGMGMGHHGQYSPKASNPLPTHNEECSPTHDEPAPVTTAVEDMPRPDSPIESHFMPLKRNVRISAVGGLARQPSGSGGGGGRYSYASTGRDSPASHTGQGRMSMEAGWWPDDG